MIQVLIQADISLIKPIAIVDDVQYSDSPKIELRGINNSKEPTYTLGTINLDLQISNFFSKSHNFHLIPRSTNVPLDGLLGMDFLRKHNASINYNHNFIQIYGKSFPLKYTFDNEEIENNQKTENKPLFVLQPRSETLIEFDVLNPGIKEGIVPQVNYPIDGVYLAKSIVKVNKNNKAITSVINTNESPVNIMQLQLNLEPISDYNVINDTNLVKQIQKDISRNDLLDRNS